MDRSRELLEKAWEDVCRALLGDEIGGLEDFEKYLGRYAGGLSIKKSAISGKPVVFSPVKGMDDNAKYISNDENAEYHEMDKGTRLDINQVKDIDSILAALREKFYYAGDVVLGNSSEIELSDKCIDSSFVYKSRTVHEGSRFVAFSNQTRHTEYAFGISQDVGSRFVIAGYYIYQLSRSMENLNTFDSADCYFTANLRSCSNCMFSFNLRNRHYGIGNLSLPKDKYLDLKDKLVGEIREMLKEKKTIPGIVDLIAAPGTAPKLKKNEPTLSNKPGVSKKGPSDELNSAFKDTCGILFGKKLAPLVAFEKWLSEHVDSVIPSKSAVSGKDIYLAAVPAFAAIKDNAVGLEEALELGECSISESDLLDFDFSNAREKLKGVKYTTTEDVHGTNNFDIVECSNYGNNSSHAFRSSLAYVCRYVAYCYWPRNSEYVFGSQLLFHSKFCIKCHNSSKLNRCFEVDSSNTCSDCYFCHNCENLQECMFCFNAKSLRYAVGNVEYPREEYLALKKRLLAQIAETLEREKALGLSIYDVGAERGVRIGY